MNSITQILLTQSQLEAAVRAAFGYQTSLRQAEELPDGMYNTAWKMTLSDGLECVIKIAPPDSVRVLRYEHNVMQAEVEALRLVRQHTEMPVPEVLAYDPSRQVLPSPFYFMSFVPGESLHKLHKQLTAEEYTAIQREAGRLLAQMNQITGNYFGYFAHPDYQFNTWAQAFPVMLAGIFQDGRDAQVELPVPYADLEALATQAYFALDEVTVPNLVHWDLWDGNVFVDPATRQITGMIDFERSLWGDPLMEQNFANIWDVTGFIAGYGREMLQTRSQKLRRSLYNLYLFAIMVIECTYRQFPTPDQENWARGKVLEEAQNLEALLRRS